MHSQTFDALRVGAETRWAHLVTAEEVDAFARLSGDLNPLHLDAGYARRQGFSGRVVHGALVGAFLSRVLGTRLPGPGVLWLSQDTKFLQPVYINDRIEVCVTVKHKAEALRSLLLETTVTNQHGDVVVRGEAKVMLLEQPRKLPWQETVALVTGGSRGIGAAVALALGRKGARVAVHYHTRRESAEEVAAGVRAAGGEAVALEGDLGSVESLRALAGKARERFGPVHVLVNNASPRIERKPVTALSWEELELYWNAYVRAAHVLGQELIPAMKEQGYGRIVQVLTSAIVNTPPPELGAYAAAKAALWGLSKVLAVELAPHGITVNAVSPSAVVTDQWEGVPESRKRGMALRNPMRRLASPEDVAAAVVHLASEEARYVTGQNLLLTGGEVM
jgi:3-oxoacyl-[acyl-carrier protein] reductase